MLRPGETWTITVPYASPSQNVTDRMHWAKKARLKKEFCLELKVAIARLGRAVVPVEYKSCLHVTRHSTRTLDQANMVGGLKIHIDCFRDLGLIFDDSPTWLQDTYEQVKVKGKSQCTIFALSRP